MTRKFFITMMISLFAFTACTTTTVVPTETAESTETPATALVLEQNYSVQLANATISIDYPTTWVSRSEFADFGVTIASTEALAINSAFDGTVSEGEVYIEILYSPESALGGDTPSAVLQTIVDSIENLEGTISEIEARDINGKTSAFVTLDSTDSSDGMFLVIDSGDAYSTIVVAFSDDTLTDNQATIEAIAGSIEYLLLAEDATEDAEMTPEATEDS